MRSSGVDVWEPRGLYLRGNQWVKVKKGNPMFYKLEKGQSGSFELTGLIGGH